MRGNSFIVFTIAVLILVLIFHWITVIYAHFFGKRGRNYFYREFYECGFKAVPDIRFVLDLQFSSLGIIFLIYDMEIVLLTPILVNILQLPSFAAWITLIIIIILGLSYWYEWEKYTLNWSFN